MYIKLIYPPILIIKNPMITFEQIAHPYKRAELLAVGGIFRPNKAQINISQCDIKLEKHLQGVRKYGFKLVKKSNDREMLKTTTNSSLLSGQRSGASNANK